MARTGSMRLSDVVVVPFFTAALVLGWSGAAKLRRPAGLSTALGSAGLPAGWGGVRLLAFAEVAVGVWCLARPSAAGAATMGLLYLGFCAFLSWLLLSGRPSESCGCAGDRDVPPSWLHVGLDAAAAGSAFGFAVSGRGAPGIVGVAAGLPLHGISFLVGVVLLGYLSFLCAAYLPSALTSYQGRR